MIEVATKSIPWFVTSRRQSVVSNCRLLILAAITLAAFLFPVTSGRAAEEPCPAWTIEDNPRLETVGIYSSRTGKMIKPGARLDATVHYWFRGVWFSMPLGYINEWVLAERSFILTDKKALEQRLKENLGADYQSKDYSLDKRADGWQRFTFWMPQRRYVERNQSYSPSFRPCESGRAKPEQDQYIVKFRIKWPFLDGPLTSNAGRAFKVHFERLKTNFYKYRANSVGSEYNMNGPISGTNFYQIIDNEGEVFVMLRCSSFRGEKKPPNPGCDGRVWDRSSNLVLYIFFPSDQGQDGEKRLWIAPVQAAISLAKQWRVK